MKSLRPSGAERKTAGSGALAGSPRPGGTSGPPTADRIGALARSLPQIPDTPGKFVVVCISGQRVLATPEEVEAVQVFTRRLVEDYGCREDQTGRTPSTGFARDRPTRNSDEERSAPVDIVVFRGADRTQGDTQRDARGS